VSGVLPGTVFFLCLILSSIASRADESLSLPTGRIGFVNGVNFPRTQAGIQAALDQAAAAGEGTVWVSDGDVSLASGVTVPAATTLHLGRGNFTFTGTAGFRLSNMSTLEGQGYGSTRIVAGPKFSGRLVENADTTGSQESCRILNLEIDGARASGARVDAGIRVKRIYVMTTIRDISVHDCSGNGVRIEGTDANSVGQLVVENVWVNNGGDYNFYINAAARNIWLNDCSSERPGRNTAGLYINGTTTKSGQNVGCRVSGFYTEIADTMSAGILVDGAAAVEIDNYTAVSRRPGMRAGVEVRNSASGIHGFSPSNLTIRDLWAECDTLVLDRANGVTITSGGDPRGNPYKGLAWYTSPNASGTTPSNGYRGYGQIVGIQPGKQGPRIGSARVIAPHPDGSVFLVTGSSTVSTITGSDYFLWKVTYFMVSTAVRFNSAGNIRLSVGAGDFVGNGSGGYDILALMWDGRQWNEVSRSLN
jgi:hypothetical protein